MPVSETTTESSQPPGFSYVRIDSLDAERTAAVWTNGWVPLFRSCGIGDEGLQTELSTPFENAAAAILDVVGRIIASSLITTRAVVKIKQDVILAIDATAFVAFNLEKVEFFAILVRAAVADIFENGFVLDHPCGQRTAGINSGDLIRTRLTFSQS